MKTRLFRLATAALLALGATRANAQITTVVAGPKRTDAKAQAAAQRDSAAQDSVARVTLTDMKSWVDSAAASLALRPDTGTVPADSATPATAVQEPSMQPRDTAAARRRIANAPPDFRAGARAPDTATQVPTVAVLGAVMILAGLALRRWRTARVRSRSSE